jgi:uncharacterized protein YlxW (UPF0749 family)
VTSPPPEPLLQPTPQPTPEPTPEPTPQPTRSPAAWRVLVPATAAAAGLLFALTATTADGTDLRAERRDVTDRVQQLERDVSALERQASRLRDEVGGAADRAAAEDARVEAQRQRAAAVAPAAGLTAVTGPGLRVSLDDAPRPEGGEPASDNPDDLVVHQEDLQAVVNALWAGGAEAMTLMGQRIVSTSAVRCVGNTVVLHGRVYGPPFEVAAIGDPEALSAALDAAPGVQFFRTFVDRFGLGYEVRRSADLDLPAYDGPLELPAVRPS